MPPNVKQTGEKIPQPYLHPYSEKHQDGHRAGKDICHDVLGHFLQTETSGGQDPGGVQTGAGLSATAALRCQREAARGGSGQFRSTQRQITSGVKVADVKTDTGSGS